MKFRQDSYYINKIKEGDTLVFANLVDKHKKMVFNVALQLMGNREDAEEVAQDAFLKAFKALGSYKGESKFSTWIYRITYNVAVSRLRKKKLPMNSIDENTRLDTAIHDTQSGIKGLQHEERVRYLNQALENLDRESRTIIMLYYLEENSVDEICEITGLSLSNVKVKLHRARKRMYAGLQFLLQGEAKTIL